MVKKAKQTKIIDYILCAMLCFCVVLAIMEGRFFLFFLLPLNFPLSPHL